MNGPLTNCSATQGGTVDTPVAINANLKTCIEILDAIKRTTERIGLRLGLLPPVEMNPAQHQPPNDTAAMAELIRYELDTMYHLLEVFSGRIG